MPQMLKILRDQAKHFAAVVVRCTASPARSGSRQCKRISSRFIMYVPGNHDLALKNTQRSRRHEKSEELKKLKRAKS